jgi:hypothetical protein
MALDAAASRRVALTSLLASNAINVGFLAFDERMWTPELLTGSALLAGALAYVVAVPLVWRDRRAGYQLLVVVIPLASVVVVGDNFSAFGSTPNLATYWLNWAFFAVQLPLAWAVWGPAIQRVPA